MKLQQHRIILLPALSLALFTAAIAQTPLVRRGGPPVRPPISNAVSATVAGTISQFNYNRDADIEGFLLSDKTLIHLPPRAATSLDATFHSGDSVQITGYAQTSPTGMRTIEAQSIQDRTSGKSLTIPQPGAAAPYSGSGRIRQLNFGQDGTINGFLTDNNTLATVPPFAGMNPSSLQVGATVGYTGFARNTISGRTAVDVQTLTINGQALTLGMAPGTDPTRAGSQANGGVRPPAGVASTPSVPVPQGRTAEPPPPVSPPPVSR